MAMIMTTATIPSRTPRTVTYNRDRKEAMAMTPTHNDMAIAYSLNLHVNVFAREYAALMGMNIASESVRAANLFHEEKTSNAAVASYITHNALSRPVGSVIRDSQLITANNIVNRPRSRKTLTPWDLATKRYKDARYHVLSRAKSKGRSPSQKMMNKYLISEEEITWTADNAYDTASESSVTMSEDDTDYEPSETGSDI